MSSNYWAKVFIEMLDDRKTATLPDSSWRRFIECILLAKELDEDGYLPSVPDMAWRLRVDAAALNDDLTRLALAGLLELREGDRWFVTNFSKRQDKMGVNERVARHRQAKRKNEYYNEFGNDDVTHRYTEKSREEKEKEGEGEGERGAIAPAPPTPGPTFQPVPPEVKRQKSRRGDTTPEPTMITEAPAVIRLLAEKTGYWPGADVAPTLVQEFGESPDESALTRAIELWKASSHKLTNWLGIADWYREIRQRPDWTPQDRFKNGNGRLQPAPVTVSNPPPGSQPVTW